MWSRQNCFAGTGRSSSSAINPPAEAGWRPGRALCLAALFAGALWAAAGGPAAAAGAVKLTDAAQHGNSWCKFVRISPDGSRVVFSADTASGDTAAIFSVPITGGTVTQLAGGTVVAENYLNLSISGDPEPAWWGGKSLFEITPDGQSVVFSSEPSVGNVDLYTVPITGGSQVHLAALAGDPDQKYWTTVSTLNFTISPDSSRVVFGLNSETDAEGNVSTVTYSVPTSGAQAPVTLFDLARVEGPYLINVGAIPAPISPNGGKVIATDGASLYIADIDGGPVTTLATAGSGLQLTYPHFTTDGSRVLYITYSSFGSSATNTYSVGVDGGDPILATTEFAPLVRPKGIVPGQVTTTPDGKHIIQAETLVLGVTKFSRFELATGESTSMGTVTTGTQRYLFQRAVLHDASGAIYCGDDDSEQWSLWYVPFAGDVPIRLAADVPAGESYPNLLAPAIADCLITPDDQIVVYEQPTTDGYELYCVSVTGGPAIRLDHDPGAGSYIRSFELTPDGEYVVYLVGDEPALSLTDVSHIHCIYAVSVHGGTPWMLNDPLAEGECIDGYTLAPDGTVVYWAGSNADGYDLYAAPVPEPASMALLAAAGTAMIGRRRRQGMA